VSRRNQRAAVRELLRPLDEVEAARLDAELRRLGGGYAPRLFGGAS